MRTRFALGLVGTAAVLTGGAALAMQSSGSLSGDIKIDGSSTVYPITEAVAEEFRKLHPNVRITVGVSGTGGGFKRFAVGETDISNASRPIKKAEHDAAMNANPPVEYIEIPVAFDGLSFVVNKSNTWCDTLTVDQIKAIFLDGSTVKTWKDINPQWPSTPIKLYSPGTDSGTFDYFKEVVAGDKGSIRGDMSVSEDDNVLVRGVEGDTGALGFFGCAYYFENKDKLKVLAIDAGKGPVTPTHETVETGTYAPFSRPLFIYVNKNSASRPEVKAFVEFYIKESNRLSNDVGYVGLPQDIVRRAMKNFAAGKTGTQFLDAAGEKVSGSLDKVYK